MQKVRGLFWCPRCGTIKYGDTDHDIEAPNLVERVVEFGSLLNEDHGHHFLIGEFDRLGIRESITPPGCV